eukprot:jgi/Ulvmu1/199/UM001_0203.1
MGLFPAIEDAKTWAWWKKKLLKHFLPLGFLLALAVGLLWPWLGQTISSWKVEGYRVIPTFHLCTIFLISGLTLKTQDAIDALKAPAGLIYGLIAVLGLTPLLGFAMLQIPFDNKAFATGLAIFCSVPTTLSSGIALVRAAYGNAALALLICIGTNTIGIATIPFYLSGMLSSSTSVKLDAVDLLIKLVIGILVPLGIGKALQTIAAVQRFVQDHKTLLMILNNGSLIMVLWQSISRSQEDITGTPFGQICLLILSGVAVHVVYLAVNFAACKLLRLNSADFIAVVIMTSQKTLPISLSVISFLPVATFGRHGLLSIPCIVGHLSQLFIDAVISSRIAAVHEAADDAARLKEAGMGFGAEDSNAIGGSSHRGNSSVILADVDVETGSRPPSTS